MQGVLIFNLGKKKTQMYEILGKICFWASKKLGFWATHSLGPYRSLTPCTVTLFLGVATNGPKET